MRFRNLLFFLVLMLFVSGCGQKELPEESTECEVKIGYEIWFEELPSPDAALEGLLEEGEEPLMIQEGVDGERIYRMHHVVNKQTNTSRHILQELAPPYLEWSNVSLNPYDWGNDGAYYADKVSTMEGGVVHFLLNNQENMYLGRWSRDKGPELLYMVDNPEINWDYLFGKEWTVDRSGVSYCMWSGGMDVWKERFQLRESLPEKNLVRQLILADGEAYGYGSLEGKNGIWKLSGGELLWEAPDQTGVQMVAPDGAGGFFYLNHQEVGSCTESEERIVCSYEKGPEWSIIGLYADEDGKPLLLAGKGNGYVLGRMVQVELSAGEKQEVVLAIKSDDFLKKAVKAYNIQSSRYHVTVEEPDTGENWLDYRTRIALELTTGKGPDLILEGLIDDPQGSVKKGMLQEMDCSRIPTEQICKGVLECGMYDGKLYVFPYKAFCYELVTSEQMAARLGQGTLQDYMRAVRESGAEVFAGGLDGYGIIYFLLFGGGINTDFLDWEAGTCSFDRKEFVELLEFAAEYADPGSREETKDRIEAGEIAFSVAQVSMLQEMWFQEALFDGKEVFCGFPSRQGGRGRLSVSGLVLNAMSKQKEGAMDFLAYLISDQVQGSITDKHLQDGALASGFPVLQKELDRMISGTEDIKTDSSQSISREGCSYRRKPFTEKQTQALRNMMETAVPEGETGVIHSMIVEETGPFFAGDRTAKQVAASLQSRVQLYLDERN